MFYQTAKTEQLGGGCDAKQVMNYDLTLYYKANLHNLLHLVMLYKGQIRFDDRLRHRKTDYFSVHYHHFLSKKVVKSQ